MSDSSEPEGQEVLYSARDSLDEAKMQIDHKMVNLAPGMPARPLRRTLTSWNLSINLVSNRHFAMQQNAIASQQKGCRLRLRILPRRILVKKTSLSIAAAAAVLIAGGTAGFAAELPTYEVTGFPISAVQVRVLGAANVQEQSLVPTSAASPHQLSVLTPRTKMTTATVAPTRTETGRSIR